VRNQNSVDAIRSVWVFPGLISWAICISFESAGSCLYHNWPHSGVGAGGRSRFFILHILQQSFCKWLGLANGYSCLGHYGLIFPWIEMLWSSGGLSNAKLTWLLQPKVFEVMRIVICQCTWVQHIHVTNVKILLQILLTCIREKLLSNVAYRRYHQHSNVRSQKLRFSRLKNRKIRWEYPKYLTTKSTNFLKFCEFWSCHSVSDTRFGMSVQCKV
jgi:hypothetical protein